MKKSIKQPDKGILKEYFPEWGKRKTSHDENITIALFVTILFYELLKVKIKN